MKTKLENKKAIIIEYEISRYEFYDMLKRQNSNIWEEQGWDEF